MKITFETDNEGTTFAVAKKETYKGRIHDELLYAEISKKENVFYLLWEDSFPKKETHSSLENAQTAVLREYTSHKPYSNGSSYDIKDL